MMMMSISSKRNSRRMVATTLRALLLFLGATATVAASQQHHHQQQPQQTFTGLSQALPLYPGEISNTWHRIVIPSGPIAISQFAADLVEKDTHNHDNLVAVPLRDAYLHHYMVFRENEEYYQDHVKQQKQKQKQKQSYQDHHYHGIAFGAGTESRETPQICHQYTNHDRPTSTALFGMSLYQSRSISTTIATTTTTTIQLQYDLDTTSHRPTS
jgi:Stress up-regulated Nod 19